MHQPGFFDLPEHLKRHSEAGDLLEAMAERIAIANAARSRVRARVEHVFAQQKDRLGLIIRTVGLKRAEAKIGLTNLAYNLQRYLFHERRAAQAA